MDFIILLGLFLAVVIFGIYLGWKSHEHFMINVIKDHPEIMEAACRAARDGTFEDEVTVTLDDGQEITASGIELMIEKVNGMLYAYSKDNNQFVAQGETMESLLKSAHDRFPGKIFFGDLPE